MNLNKNASGKAGAKFEVCAHNYNRFTDPFTEISSRLKGVVRRSNGGLLAFCPSHEDRSRSLAVSVGRHGGVLLHCFAGCGIDDITGAIGLSPADLFVKNETTQLNQQLKQYDDWRSFQSMRLSLLLVRLPGIKHDLVRLLFVANTLRKNEALPADDRQFVAELILRINSALSFVEGAK